MDRAELDWILERHQHWVFRDCPEWVRMRADLRFKDLRGMDLRYANLSSACLIGADLRGADLYEADIWGAELQHAKLQGVKNFPYIPYACPEFGGFIGYKKAHIYYYPKGVIAARKQVIVELEIPEDAKRTCGMTRKCKCDKAKVLSITSLDGTENYDEAISSFDLNFVYAVGKTVEVNDFDENRWNECSKGIHFFLNRQEAVLYDI